LKIDDVAPVLYPLIEQSAIVGFHDLKAKRERLVDLARDVSQAFGSKPPMIAKASIDRDRVGVPESFNDHELHR